jgi:hypothetical protein
MLREGGIGMISNLGAQGGVVRRVNRGWATGNRRRSQGVLGSALNPPLLRANADAPMVLDRIWRHASITGTEQTFAEIEGVRAWHPSIIS